MTSHLAWRTAIGFVQLLLIVAALLLVPAWTVDYWQAWLYLAVFFSSVAFITLRLAKDDPGLLERRVQAGPGAETERSQQIIQAVAAVSFVAVFLLASLDDRFGWSDVPSAIVVLGDVLALLGFAIVYLVFRENSYTAATVRVAAEQSLISSGPYAVVRHPMYAGAMILMLGTPLALGSWWALVAVVVLGLVIVWRLLDEERLLQAQLPGYPEYQERVRHRLLPAIW
jgi:protein-S-isoprenylcysteine O-methyltransferase Ste14